MKMLPVSDSVILIARLTVKRQKRDFVSSFGIKKMKMTIIYEEKAAERFAKYREMKKSEN